ncbi:MAG: hypothetical protein WA005_08670 [Candidatus Binataceae bacterium]
MKAIADKHSDLFSGQKKAFATIATLMPDGSPQGVERWPIRRA